MRARDLDNYSTALGEDGHWTEPGAPGGARTDLQVGARSQSNIPGKQRQFLTGTKILGVLRALKISVVLLSRSLSFREKYC